MTKSQAQPPTHGFLCMVLHAHLPYVRHPEIDYIMEENWLFEALTETYLPLLSVFENLLIDRVPFRITMSLTPPLCSMLNDELLQSRYCRHIDRLIELAQKEIRRTRNDPQLNRTANMYLERFLQYKQIFEQKYSCNILPGFRALQDAGVLEIITSGATHGYLPNMQFNRQAVRAQIEVAVQSYSDFFGRPPKGIWLPECGYFPGLEKYLHEAGIRFFFMETHGVLFADPRPTYGTFAPIHCKEAPVAAFGRDVESSRSVWSAEEGYPGHPAYREFYKDIGFDLDLDYIRPYIDPAGIRINTGIKYHRITDKNTKIKQLYNHYEALRIASEHAGNFMFSREGQIRNASKVMDRPPCIVAPYDAELFGHWWYEGPEWLNFLIRKTAFEQNIYRMITPSEYLEIFPDNQVCAPSFSSWGEGGYSHVWLNESNDWIYPHLHRIEDRMVECAREHPDAQGILKRALNQMARELLLAQSSDWAFIMKTGTTVQYARRRTREHIASFLQLYSKVKEQRIDEGQLALLESHNNIFPDIDYRIYARPE
ncbi:MAG: glycoside hydrolase family 57 protein [Chitinispirillaceae bacterium]